MTGWQTAEGHGPSSFVQQHQKAMEVISQLATANQQLATANTATLANLEALYMELSREKKSRRRVVSSEESMDEALKKRLTTNEERGEEEEEEGGKEEEDEGRRRMEFRIDRLENVLRKVRSRIERLEKTNRGEDERQRSANVCDSKEIRDSDRRWTIDDPCDRLASSIDVPEREFKGQTTMDEARAKAVSRVSFVNVEGDVRGSRWNVEDRPVANLHLEKSREGGIKDETEERLDNKKEVVSLLEEVERLKGERSEYQRENERLAKELVEEKAMVKKLRKDYEVSLRILFSFCNLCLLYTLVATYLINWKSIDRSR